MMIFSYLDKETLKVARQVSPYWAFIADQVEKERSARAKLNAFLARLSVRVRFHFTVHVGDVTKLLKHQLLRQCE